MNGWQRALAAGALALLSGCATMVTPTYPPAIDNALALRELKGARLAVGRFADGPALPAGALSVRASPLAPPAGESFSGFLRQALEAELRTNGVLDAAAPLAVSGTLLAHSLDAAAGTGTATMQARFVVSRAGQTRFDRVVAVRHEWESSFMGAIAIPRAREAYVATVQKLLNALFADAEFQRAVTT